MAKKKIDFLIMFEEGEKKINFAGRVLYKA